MASSSGWNTSTIIGAVGNDQANNNSSGFSAPPGGYRDGQYGSFINEGYSCIWWSATEGNATDIAWLRHLSSNIYYVDRASYKKSGGHSVRCVRDN